MRRLPPALMLAIAAIALPASTRAEDTTSRNATPRTPTMRSAGWNYPLPIDHGIRADRGGHGYFMAPRRHGYHNGIDLLAPVGTPIVASCDGKARSGTRGAFGHWVQLVCRVPSGKRSYHVSLFHAHVQKKHVPKGWVDVKRGSPLATVGKTGNAIGPRIMPHLHLELIVHAREQDALAERHSGRNQSNTGAADAFYTELLASCSRSQSVDPAIAVRRARRMDPFAVLSCLAPTKPAYARPKREPLRSASRSWSDHYHGKSDSDLDG